MDWEDPMLEAKSRRNFIRSAASGTTLAVFGGIWMLSDQLTQEARAETRADGRPRLPPGQRVISALKPMGGVQGDPRPSAFELKLHGEVGRSRTLSFADLVGVRPVELTLDVHCVTGWSALDVRFKGVRVRDLAALCEPSPSSRHVIFEAAHGYTANVPLNEALHPDVLVAWEINGRRLPRAHGAPVRAVHPNLYFWKSAKWLEGVRFQRRDEPGYWETRGYHNHADPWKEERYA